ncbi:hypothetical protein EON79_10790, partial [bacterium]
MVPLLAILMGGCVAAAAMFGIGALGKWRFGRNWGLMLGVGALLAVASLALLWALVAQKAT